MEGVYVSGGIELRLGDCMDFMRCVPDNHYSLAIVDPPYGLGITRQSQGLNGGVVASSTDRGDDHWDDAVPSHAYFRELQRVSRNQIIFGVNYFDYPLPGGRLIWDKLNKDSDQSGCEIAYCSLNDRVDVVYYLWRGMIQGLVPSVDVLKASVQQGDKRLNERRIQICQKPVKLYEWILMKYASEGDNILDTHGGSFSLAIAADRLGFSLTAIEASAFHYKNGVDRFISETSQMRMFKEAPSY